MAVLSCFWKFFFISYQIGWNALLLVKNWKPMAIIKENSKRHQNWKTTDYWYILKPNVWVPKMTMFTKPQFPTSSGKLISQDFQYCTESNQRIFCTSLIELHVTWGDNMSNICVKTSQNQVIQIMFSMEQCLDIFCDYW